MPEFEFPKAWPHHQQHTQKAGDHQRPAGDANAFGQDQYREDRGEGGGKEDEGAEYLEKYLYD